MGELVPGILGGCGTLCVVCGDDLAPTNVRLHSIHLIAPDACEETDTLIHRLTESGASVNIYTWVSATIHRKTPRQISREWFLCPAFKIWPCPKHQANLRFLAHMVFYVVKNCRLLTAIDYVDFMRRKRWRDYQYHTLLKNIIRVIESA